MEVLSSRLIVYPRDFARTVAWYDDVLGLARYREFGSGGRITGVVYFDFGGLRRDVGTDQRKTIDPDAVSQHRARPPWRPHRGQWPAGCA